MDFSQPSRDALRMAILLAKAFHSEIILIHVIPEITGLKIDRGKVRRIETQKLREIEMDLKAKGITSVETIVRFGTPFERIIVGTFTQPVTPFRSIHPTGFCKLTRSGYPIPRESGADLILFLLGDRLLRMTRK